jgi:hypothetical protein
MSEKVIEANTLQLDTIAYKFRRQQRENAQAAARLGVDFIAAVRHDFEAAVRALLVEDSPAKLAFDMFGTRLFRLDLRLDDPEEVNRLAPIDLQIDPQMALLELAVVVPLEQGEGHLKRLFGSGLLLQPADNEYGWLVLDVIPVNSDGGFREGNTLDEQILAVHQGRENLPLQTSGLSKVEQKFLSVMQSQNARFNLEELFNALRLWRGFTAALTVEKSPQSKKTVQAWERYPNSWAAAVEYLITLFDYFEVDEDALVKRYRTTATLVSNRYQEIAQTLNVTQFDDRYSIHPDPVTHYKSLFDDIGIDYRNKKQLRDDLLKGGIFNQVAPIPEDDEDFFGPGGL